MNKVLPYAMMAVDHLGPKLLRVDQEPKNPVGLDAPRGFYQARIDLKGRLKLSSDIHQYLEANGHNKLFATTIDELTARLYTIPAWKETHFKLMHAGEAAEDGEAIAFMANHYGGDCDVDSQGRLLVPQELRQKLELEDKPVWLSCQQDRVEIYGEAIYKEKLRDAQARKASALARLKPLGI